MPTIPKNMALYKKVKAEAKRKFAVWPSAYGSAWLVKTYKKRGGTYDGCKSPGRKSKRKKPKRKSTKRSNRKSKRKRKSPKISKRKSKRKSPKTKSRKKTSTSEGKGEIVSNPALDNPALSGRRNLSQTRQKQSRAEKLLKRRQQTTSNDDDIQITLNDDDIQILGTIGGTSLEQNVLPRTFCLVRLQKDYIDLQGNPLEYLPFYYSSGANSLTPDVCYPFYGITMAAREINTEGETAIKNLMIHSLGVAEKSIPHILDGTDIVSLQPGLNIDWSTALIPNSIGSFILKCGIVELWLKQCADNYPEFLTVLNQDIFQVTPGLNYNPRLCNNVQKQYSDALSDWSNNKGGKEKINAVGEGVISKWEDINKEIKKNNIFGIDLYELNEADFDASPQRKKFKEIVDVYNKILENDTSPNTQGAKQVLDVLRDSLRYQTINKIFDQAIKTSKLQKH